MECPYCKKEMREGILSGDARQGVCWKEGEKKASVIDKVVGSCKVTAAKVGLSTFTIPAHFCEDCKKMIIDTDVTK
jgi:hypothetical protein